MTHSADYFRAELVVKQNIGYIYNYSKIPRKNARNESGATKTL